METKFEKINTFVGSKRYVAILAAIVLWIISIAFNTDGFNFKIPERAWMGISLGIIVTVLQLIGNSTNLKTDPILFAMCMIAYLYSIYMDVVGISTAMAVKVDWSANGILPIALGAFIEITPEPLILWALKLKTNGLNVFDKKQKSKPILRPLTSAMKPRPTFIPPERPSNQRPVYHNQMDEGNESPVLQMMREELRKRNLENVLTNKQN